MDRIQAATFLDREDRTLAGFILGGRWPDTTHEWAQLLTLAVRVAAGPGLVPRTRIFQAIEERPEGSPFEAVGMMILVGSVAGPDAVGPGCLSGHTPRALFVLHPPQETNPSVPEAAGAASGCILLPGLPHLGLDHRASWVEAQADGTVTRLMSQVNPNSNADPDLAVLSLLCAA